MFILGTSSNTKKNPYKRPVKKNLAQAPAAGNEEVEIPKTIQDNRLDFEATPEIEISESKEHNKLIQ